VHLPSDTLQRGFVSKQAEGRRAVYGWHHLGEH
jgi:hypothetical protein